MSLILRGLKSKSLILRGLGYFALELTVLGNIVKHPKYVPITSLTDSAQLIAKLKIGSKQFTYVSPDSNLVGLGYGVANNAVVAYSLFKTKLVTEYKRIVRVPSIVSSKVVAVTSVAKVAFQNTITKLKR